MNYEWVQFILKSCSVVLSACVSEQLRRVGAWMPWYFQTPISRKWCAPLVGAGLASLRRWHIVIWLSAVGRLRFGSDIRPVIGNWMTDIGWRYYECEVAVLVCGSPVLSVSVYGTTRSRATWQRDRASDDNLWCRGTCASRVWEWEKRIKQKDNSPVTSLLFLDFYRFNKFKAIWTGPVDRP